MKPVLILGFFLCLLPIQAQVGINTATPNAQLDIRSGNQATPSNTDGLIIPKIDAFPSINPTAAQQGMMVYLTTAATFSGNAKSVGFYYWDDVSVNWIAVGDNNSRGWNTTGNSGTNAATHFIGTTDNVNLIFKRNNTRAGLISTSNTSFGNNSLNPLSTGFQNSAFGTSALFSNTSGTFNSAFGINSLYSNTSGDGNTALGLSSLYFNTTGGGNTATGYQTLYATTTGFYNSAYGWQSMISNTTGHNNTAYGVMSLSGNTTGLYNSAFGNVTLMSNITGSHNAAFGNGALASNTTGQRNSAYGISALSLNTTANNSSAFGYSALGSNITGEGNAAFGNFSSGSNTTGNSNASFGAYSLTMNATGTANSAFGFGSLATSTNSVGNSAFGYSSLNSNITGVQNSAFGFESLRYNTTGFFNAAFGSESLLHNTTGFYNTAMGARVLQSNTTGNFNTGIGTDALSVNTVGIENVAVGVGALKDNTTGFYNVGIGADALAGTTTGTRNTAIGIRSLNANINGDANTVIGALSDVVGANLTNATAIGAYAEVSTSNSLILGSINGVNGALASTNVGIGTTAPQTRLDIVDENAVPGVATDGNLLVRTNNPQGIDIGGSITLGGMADDGGVISRNFASIEGRKANGTTGVTQGYLTFKTNSGAVLAERIRITSAGDVGIGTATPGGQFELSLNEGRKPGSNTWTVPSDSRLKTIDGAYTKGLNEIIRLRPIRYHYKNNNKRKFEQKVLDAEFSGFIAQEVQPLFPDAVQPDADGFLNFNMHSILVASINAIKELNEKIAVLEQNKIENEQLKQQIQMQQHININLEERIKAIEQKLGR